jgi:ribosomal protein S18 acetylase RimI-like enzyme
VYEIIHADLAAGHTRQWLGKLLQDYHRKTEQEKAAHGIGTVSAGGLLPAKYQHEIDRPSEAFANSRVFIAHKDAAPIGMVVLTPVGQTAGEVKRLWVDPSLRGSGVGAALLREALLAAEECGSESVRLTVWEWREPALRSYLRRGFRVVPSWEERAGLQCMELRLPGRT